MHASGGSVVFVTLGQKEMHSSVSADKFDGCEVALLMLKFIQDETQLSCPVALTCELVSDAKRLNDDC
jgi:hypothetical protein